MIIIPMVGLSSRFFQEGYTRPKYQLLLNGVSVFSHSVRSFESYFNSDDFLFLVRNEFNAASFVQSEIKKLGIINYRIITILGNTEGQADTVFQGTKSISKEEELFIFNIDTFRPNFKKPHYSALGDGYLEVFDGEGNNWSFVLPGTNNQVIRTSEKERISNLCSDGLYYFRKKQFFDEAFLYSKSKLKRTRGEYYIAPLYNHLIENHKIIKYGIIDKRNVVFCGTPTEYRKLENDNY